MTIPRRSRAVAVRACSSGTGPSQVRFCATVAALFVFGCGGTTGSGFVEFSGVVSGPSDVSGGSATFTSGAGADITLTKAEMHLGAVYLNQSVPASGAAAEPCVSPGAYVAEIFGPVDVDLLSGSPASFPTKGEGTETEARTAEVWLTGGDVNAADDPTVILDVEGSAVQAGETYPFTASVTIGSNRTPRATSPALPSANPVCHQRIVAPILVDMTPTDGGTLVLRIDPRHMFNGVDFSRAAKVSDTPVAYEIPDTSAGPGGALFKGMTADAGVYSLAWRSSRR